MAPFRVGGAMRASLRVLPLLATLLVAAGPTTLALPPADDDAGSGRDAGPLLPGELAASAYAPIAYGVEYEGSLTPGVDDQDTYVFAGAAGDLVSLTTASPPGAVFLVDPDGMSVPIIQGDPTYGSHLLTRAGAWKLTFEQGAPPGSPRVAYAFTLARAPTSASGGVACQRAWCVVEMSVVGATYVALEGWAPIPGEDVAYGSTVFFAYEKELTRADGSEEHRAGASSIHYAPSGRGIRVMDVEDESIAFPTTEGIQVQGATGWGFVRLVQPATAGWLRVRIFTDASTAATPSIGYASDGLVTVASATGAELASWRAEEGEAESALVAPGATIVRGASTTRTLGPGFEGLFGDLEPTYSLAPLLGEAVSPSGARQRVDASATLRLLRGEGPDAGEWRFAVDEATRAGGAGFPFLVGADFPVLAVAPPAS